MQFIHVGENNPGTAADFKANVPDRVHFDFDSSRILDSAKPRVDAMACWFKSFPSTKATIEGHTDSRGTEEYNLGLGARRANSLLEALGNQGLDKGRFTVVSYGKERLEDTGTSETSHARNRRAVVVVND